MSARPSPFGDTAAPARERPWLLIAVVAALLAARLAVASSLHLTEDEAYYRLWAQAPALGYFDHPPMIAWWIWAGVHLVGDTALGVRLVPILSGVATTALIYDMTRLVGGDALQARRAGLWFNLMPLVTVGGFLAVPDAPASLMWALCLWCLLRARGDHPTPWWLAAGVAAGLATLSKYSALFIGPGVLLWLASDPAGRSRLRTAGPWLALAAAGGLFGLNVAWNASHHWLTFARQFGRVAPHQWEPRHLAEFLGAEFILLNPVVAVFVGRAAASRMRSGRAASAITPFLLTSLPFVAYLLIHSLHDRIEAHWPAPLYPALAICAALAAGDDRGRWGVLRAAVAPVGVLIAALAGVLLVLPSAGISLRHDPVGAIRGWGGFAIRIETLRRQSGASWVGTTSYGVASQLAGEPAIDAPVIQLSERARWHDLRTLPLPNILKPGILIELPRRIDVQALGRCFADVAPLGFVTRGDPRQGGERYLAIRLDRPKVDIIGAGCRR